MNWQTVLVAAIVAAALAAIMINAVKGKRNGKTACSCGCSGCAACVSKYRTSGLRARSPKRVSSSGMQT